MAYHARPRATKVLDVFVDPTADNAERVLAALREFFGGVDFGYTVDDLVEPGWIIQLGVAPVRICVHVQTPGCPNFEVDWGNRVEGRFGAAPAQYMGLEDLIQAKEATARDQDRANVRTLRRAKKDEI